MEMLDPPVHLTKIVCCNSLPAPIKLVPRTARRRYTLYQDGKNHSVPSYSGRKKSYPKGTGLVVRPGLRRVTPTKLFRRAVSPGGGHLHIISFLESCFLVSLCKYYDTMLTKEKVRKTIDRLPDNFTVDQFIEELVVLNKIEEGLKDIEQGRVFTTDQVKKELKTWLE